MSKQKFLTLVAMSLVCAAFGAKERVIQVQNSVRFGFDDNVYSQDSGEVESAFLTDIVNLTGKFNFSPRTDVLLYWQPEFRYWFDVPGDDAVTYQDFYGQLNHAVSQRTFVRVSDRFSYNEARGQLADANKAGDTDNKKYYENDLDGSIDYTLNPVSQLQIGAGQGLRRWEDSSYGGGVYLNDYEQYRLNGAYVRELKPNTTKGTAGLNYMNHEYDGSRGGYKSTTVFGGLDHNFSPNLTAFGRVGYSFSKVESSGGDEDSDNPYAQAGIDYNPTARTSMGASGTYSVTHSDNSFFNAQESLSGRLSLRHDVTGKISMSTALSAVLGRYDASFFNPFTGAGDAVDEKELYITWSLRASYQINRNNFVDVGCLFSDRSTDADYLMEHTRNRFDIGWRIKL